MNATVVRRAFGWLGPAISAMSMLAFVVSLLAEGWGRGKPWPDADGIAAASGAAFLTVVFAQKANASACRSSTRRPGQLGWTTNRMLLWTGVVELAFAMAVVFIGPIADRLEQANPPLWGWAVAVASMPVVLAVDALDKRLRARRPGIQ